MSKRRSLLGALAAMVGIAGGAAPAAQLPPILQQAVAPAPVRRKPVVTRPHREGRKTPKPIAQFKRDRRKRLAKQIRRAAWRKAKRAPLMTWQEARRLAADAPAWMGGK